MQISAREVGAGRRVGAALEVSNVIVRRAGSVVFGPLTADLSGPGIVRLVGPNGSGKSTLLRVLSGLQRPTSGRVEASHPVAFLPERFAGAPEFRVRQLIDAVRRSAGPPIAPEWDAHVIEELDVGPLLESTLGSLSHGQAQRSAIAAVLSVRPPILLMDEPWDGLDVESANRLRALLLEHAREALVVVTDHGAGRRSGATRELHLDSGVAVVPDAPAEGDRASIGRVWWELEDGRRRSGRLTDVAARALERLIADGEVLIDPQDGPDDR